MKKAGPGKCVSGPALGREGLEGTWRPAISQATVRGRSPAASVFSARHWTRIGFRVAPDADAEGRSRWATAEPEFVAIGVAERGLSDAVRVGFLLRRGESPLGDLRDQRVEVVDEDEVPGVPG